MILFSCSLPAEKKVLQRILAHLPQRTYDVFITGVGVYQTLFSLTKHLQLHRPRAVVNVWVCGRTEDITSDWIQVYRIKHLGNAKEALCPIYADVFPLVSIGCSDTIVTDAAEMHQETLVDMESFGMHFVCQKEKIPFLILKKPFDIVSPDSKKIDLSALTHVMETFPIEEVREKIDGFMEDTFVPFSENIDQIAQRHRLTWSERKNLQFAVDRALAKGENMDRFFQIFSKYNKNQLLTFLWLTSGGNS